MKALNGARSALRWFKSESTEVQRNLGLLQCSTPHYGKPPHEMEAHSDTDL